jgi:hypothetical protein
MTTSEQKMDFARTINEHGDNAFLGMSDCEHFGMTYGCRPDCPVYLKGKCEIQEENKLLFDKTE